MQHAQPTPTIVPAEYPELKLICWHRDPNQPLPEPEAFALYERNWRYIDQSALTQSEQALIERLKAHYGNGVVNG